MNRIQKKFSQLRQLGSKVISPYVIAGDPLPEVTVPLLHALVEAGADILELGIPFSDPVAEGPVIQAAMQRSLANHITLSKTLAMVAKFRERDQSTPIVVMGYLNPIVCRGYASFAKAAYEAGVDGVIIVDLPPEEATELQGELKKYAIDIIFLFSPTTSDARLKQICRVASGYLYYVSLKGVTGALTLDVDAVASKLQQLRSPITLPIVVGFGIKTPEQAVAIAKLADGIVVGAALVEKIAALQKEPDKICSKVPELISLMRGAIDGGSYPDISLRCLS